MKKIFLSIFIAVVITGCASFQPRNGMAYQDFKQMSIKSMNGEPKLARRVGNYEIYQMSSANRDLAPTNPIARALYDPSKDFYYVFSNGALVDTINANQLNSYNPASSIMVSQPPPSSAVKSNPSSVSSSRTSAPTQQQKNEAEDAFYNRDFSRLSMLSDNGNSFAQAQLGYMYSEGMGVTKNYSEALRLYRMAAAQGNTNAQANIGGAYAFGQGVTKDYAEAFKWYSMAANAGDADGQDGLGNLYERGLGVKKNQVEAIKYYSQASRNGSEDATYALARLGQIKRYTTVFICSAPGYGGQAGTLGAALFSDLFSTNSIMFSSRMSTSPWNSKCRVNTMPFTNLNLLSNAEKKVKKGSIYYLIDLNDSTSIGVIGSQ